MQPMSSPLASDQPKLRYIAGGADGDGDEPNPNEGDGTEPKPETPQYVSAEEFRQFQAQSQESAKALTEAINLMRSAVERTPAPAQPAPSNEPIVSREEYIRAVQEGDVDKVARYESQIETRFASRIGQMEQAGTNAIADLNKRTTVGNLPYYERFKKEIDTLVGTLPANLKMSPDVYKYAHDKVVGEHVTELVSEAKEAALRKPAGEDIESPSAGRSGRAVRGTSGDKIPTPRDLGGEEVEQALAFRGMDGDMQAQKMGYKSWADYMEKTKEYR
jgi:hypothetical protein